MRIQELREVLREMNPNAEVRIETEKRYPIIAVAVVKWEKGMKALERVVVISARAERDLKG